MTQASAQEILRSVFGYPSFRGYQEEIIQTLMSGQDAFVLMPTGGGKSLCYQIPSILRPGVGVVVSPLIALMQNQVFLLEQLGVAAAFLNSSLSSFEARRVEQRLLHGELDLLYVSPERLLMPHFLEQLKQCQLALFAIDEAHCVSQWGHDFRPEYLKLDVIKKNFPDIPRIALTATADKATRNEILSRLDLEQARVFVAGFDRPNIQYRIVEKENPKKQLLSFLRENHPDDSGIVYCLARRTVDDVAQWLKDEGLRALPYHAGLGSEVRQKHQEFFLQNEAVIMVATVAFGMGIDKPNVRFVAHLDLPKSIEAYYQETGRAGRDGLPAHAWLAYGIKDLIIHRHMLNESQAGAEQKRLEQRKLDALLGLCETSSCRRKTLLQYFGDNTEYACGNCDTCLFPVEQFDAKIPAQKALSCIFRTKESFGMAHLIDVLVGKETEKVQRFGHQYLSVFGIGLDLKPNEWRSIYRQLIAMGLIHVDLTGFGALRLLPSCLPIMKGASIFLRKVTRKTSVSKAKTKTKTKTTSAETMPKSELFQALKALRLELARKQNKPPYVIFHDRTLIEMAKVKPKGLSELGELYGVGEHKLRQYGASFLEVVAQYEEAHQGEHLQNVSL